MNNYLVVDDDETTLKIICLMIKDIEPKAVIKTARNSKEGLIICQHNKFNRIFTDYSMPGYTGNILIKAIREECDTQLLLLLDTKSNSFIKFV